MTLFSTQLALHNMCVCLIFTLVLTKLVVIAVHVAATVTRNKVHRPTKDNAYRQDLVSVYREGG